MSLFWGQVQHFSAWEFDSPDVEGSGAEHMDEHLVRKLDTLRGLMRRPLTISSGYRTPEYNGKIGGATRSKHLDGIAVDIPIAGEDAFKLVGLAYSLGFTGIGIKQNGKWSKRFIHLDVRETEPQIWSY